MAITAIMMTKTRMIWNIVIEEDANGARKVYEILKRSLSKIVKLMKKA